MTGLIHYFPSTYTSQVTSLYRKWQVKLNQYRLHPTDAQGKKRRNITRKNKQSELKLEGLLTVKYLKISNLHLNTVTNWLSKPKATYTVEGKRTHVTSAVQRVLVYRQEKNHISKKKKSINLSISPIYCRQITVPIHTSFNIKTVWVASTQWNTICCLHDSYLVWYFLKYKFHIFTLVLPRIN